MQHQHEDLQLRHRFSRGAIFAKGCEFLAVALGVWAYVQVGCVGVVSVWEQIRNGIGSGGVGGGGGTGKGIGKSMHMHVSKRPSSKQPFSLSPRDTSKIILHVM